MRIVSLLPSATEIVCFLGLRDALVGRSHECDFPPDVADVPVMTFSTIGVTGADGQINPNLTSAEIDALVSQQLRDGQSLYGLHLDRLDAAQPDLILTQALCDVCAVSYGTVRAAVRDLSCSWNGSAQVISLEPTDIESIFQTILIVGELTNHQALAKRKVQALRDRLDSVREALATVEQRPTVAALEWLDPPFAPGHWVPEQIELAGCVPALGRRGQPSVRCTWDDVFNTKAEWVVAMPCGFDLRGSISEALNAAARLRDLPAPQRGRLCAVDATSYFSRPGPRVVDGVEVLAGLLHPRLWPSPRPDQAAFVALPISAVPCL